ncbi:MAG: UPF0489 family protein [Desulfobulbaceae bacterium]|nr:UPF0489 family protein [Desulfobulbaceae bacterium]
MKHETTRWLIPFKGRDHSGAYDHNFLWKQGCVYVMDNHRAALWCWHQEIDLRSSHSIFHIDRHTDCLQSKLDEWLAHLPSSWTLSIEEYMSHSYQADTPIGKDYTPVFRWDNFLSLYLSEFGKYISRCYFATHDDGDKPNHARVMKSEVESLPGNFDYWLNGRDKPWIVDIDLDYFFYRDDEGYKVMVSDEYLDTLFKCLRSKIDAGVVVAVTIALTPCEEFTGGWEASEKLAQRVLKIMDIEFRLPTL